MQVELKAANKGNIQEVLFFHSPECNSQNFTKWPTVKKSVFTDLSSGLEVK